MKKTCLIVLAMLFLLDVAVAQSGKHKIVFDFVKSDTASYAAMVRQARYIMSVEDKARLEIVCHGPGLDLLLKEKSTVQKDISELNAKYHVVFVACKATMNRRGINKNQLLPESIVVPSALLEMSAKQQEQWSYIRAGY